MDNTGIRASSFYSTYSCTVWCFCNGMCILLVYSFKHFNFIDYTWLLLYLKHVLEPHSLKKDLMVKKSFNLFSVSRGIHSILQLSTPALCQYTFLSHTKRRRETPGFGSVCMGSGYGLWSGAKWLSSSVKSSQWILMDIARVLASLVGFQWLVRHRM